MLQYSSGGTMPATVSKPPRRVAAIVSRHTPTTTPYPQSNNSAVYDGVMGNHTVGHGLQHDGRHGGAP